ncbi:uncharacterized protein [Ambystoma mexicanum]|uniref:uncharacterized protein n=1 Tax=Ambystoma mexicanum TaxID=8296 RepID=UPI0037E9A705
MKRLECTLQRLSELGLTLHRGKCTFFKDRIGFFGFIFHANGVSPDPKKIKDIREAAAPQSPTEVRSFLGMVNYCGRFIKGLASLSEPLRALTKNDATSVWDKREHNAFLEIKRALSD